MQTVDSKKQQLPLQEVIVRSIYAQKDALSVPPDVAILQLVAELQMENSEALQFGNTVFVTHYSPESPLCVMYALNADTARNYINNGEKYVRHLMKNGIRGFVTSYSNESFGVPFKTLERKKLGIVDTTKTPDKRFMTIVKFNNPTKVERRNV